MSDNTPLGDRMKRYEWTFRHYLPRRSYTLLRLDGVAFHTYLRGADKPFDRGFITDMDRTAQYLCESIQGVQLAYVQSDEISLLLTDFDSTQTEPWYGANIQKLVSVSAAKASAYFAVTRRLLPGLPCFDARAWSVADPVEVANYFLWRQRDAVRNSIQMVGQSFFSPAQLHCKSTGEVQEMLFQKHQINWSNFPDGDKRGRVVLHTEDGWFVIAAPHFKAERGSFLDGLIPPLPSLRYGEEGS